MKKTPETNPVIPFIEGDGIGPEVWKAARSVLDAAVRKAFDGKKKILWKEILAGEKSHKATGEWLPQETVEALRNHPVAIKGPLTTPVGEGFRSLNVTLRQTLDLFACIRPVRYFPGVPTPVKDPQKLDVVIFRENTEDVYAGIEFASGSTEAKKLRDFLLREMKASIREDAAIGIKPMGPFATKRLARMAIQYAKEHGRPSVTFVHKGNIMKFTEGAFCRWGYAVAGEEFGDITVTEKELKGDAGNKIVVKDRIADAMFQMLLLSPQDYSVIVTPNLNGDYLSDACAAQVGGLGMAPGANIGDKTALFEATHGTAPGIAGKDEANPTSLILSGVMMLEHLGWNKAARCIIKGIEKTIAQKTVTRDLERQMSGATGIPCSAYGEAVVRNME